VLDTIIYPVERRIDDDDDGERVMNEQQNTRKRRWWRRGNRGREGERVVATNSRMRRRVTMKTPWWRHTSHLSHPPTSTPLSPPQIPKSNTNTLPILQPNPPLPTPFQNILPKLQHAPPIPLLPHQPHPFRLFRFRGGRRGRSRS